MPLKMAKNGQEMDSEGTECFRMSSQIRKIKKKLERITPAGEFEYHPPAPGFASFVTRDPFSSPFSAVSSHVFFLDTFF